MTFSVSGEVRVSGDKSISHRALMLSALAEGTSRITGILESADVQSTAGVLRAWGVKVPALGSDFIDKLKTIHALNFMRSATAPEMSASVMIANISWKAMKA